MAAPGSPEPFCGWRHRGGTRVALWALELWPLSQSSQTCLSFWSLSLPFLLPTLSPSLLPTHIITMWDSSFLPSFLFPCFLPSLFLPFSPCLSVSLSLSPHCHPNRAPQREQVSPLSPNSSWGFCACAWCGEEHPSCSGGRGESLFAAALGCWDAGWRGQTRGSSPPFLDPYLWNSLHREGEGGEGVSRKRIYSFNSFLTLLLTQPFSLLPPSIPPPQTIPHILPLGKQSSFKAGDCAWWENEKWQKAHTEVWLSLEGRRPGRAFWEILEGRGLFEETSLASVSHYVCWGVQGDALFYIPHSWSSVPCHFLQVCFN